MQKSAFCIQATCIFFFTFAVEKQVLKNSDELFGFDGISAPADFVDGVDASVLIVEPSFSVHEKLMEWMKQGKHEAEGGLHKLHPTFFQSYLFILVIIFILIKK